MLVLDVFLENIETPVAQLACNDDGSLSFVYIKETLPHPVSLGLPVREAPFGDVDARPFFANLLFENAQRDDVMARYGLDSGDTAGLLYYLGQDCPGAISIVPSGEGPGKRLGILSRHYDPLDDVELERIMVSLRDHRRVPGDTRDPSPLAGVQGMPAICWRHGATTSTTTAHIPASLT